MRASSPLLSELPPCKTIFTTHFRKQILHSAMAVFPSVRSSPFATNPAPSSPIRLKSATEISPPKSFRPRASGNPDTASDILLAGTRGPAYPFPLGATKPLGVLWSSVRAVKETLNSLVAHSKQVFVVALLLATIFVAAQLHCCVDLNSTSADSHACPFCSTVGAAIATGAMILGITPALRRLEISYSFPALLHTTSRNTTPRAPPAFS